MMSTSIISFFLATVMMFTPVCAGTQANVLFENPNNYTEETSFEMTLDNSEEFYLLLKELELPEEYEYFSDVKKLLETLFSAEGKVCVQADISEDMKKVQVAVVSEGANSIEFNRNLKFDISAKLGIWLRYDMTDNENPVFEMIYSIPRMEKYVHLDVIEILPEEEKEELITVINELISIGNSAEITTFTEELFEKYADVEESPSSATIKIDNKGLLGIIKEVAEYILSINELYMLEEDASLMKEELAAFDFESLQILGENGIVVTYNFKNGNISSSETNTDISIDLSGIYAEITGEKWGLSSDGKIDFTINSKTEVSKIGSTKVEFPAINEENSISLTEIIKEEMAYESEYEEYPRYPYYYISEDTEGVLPVIDGEIYVPLRKTLESAYEDSVNIEFENGVITATSEYFTKFKTMQLTDGSDKVYFDGAEKTTSKVLIIDGTTYVNYNLFTEHFGWDYFSATHNLVEDTYRYMFYTE